MKKIAITILLLFATCYQSSPAFAQVMSNDSYILEQGGFSSFAGQATGTSYTVTDSGGKIVPGLYEGNNYLLRANFYYGETASSSSGFTFSISNSAINFGTIKAGEPVVRTNILSVNSPDSGYQVTASENNPLKAGNNTIPDTTCDSGNCTQTVSALWTSPLTYGFGYRCDDVENSQVCNTNFSRANYFTQFSNSQTGETAVSVMSDTEPSITQAQITYKLNVSSTQPAGAYQNIIKYIAIPSL